MRIFLPVLFVIATAPAFAQFPSTSALTLSNRDLLPLSPEAASLGRYGDVPVSLYTGVPSIEIPLYTFHTTAVDVPVKLQYHGGGVRLDQKATWAGLGWNLMAGGAITRVCRGIDDFTSNGYANGALRPPNRIVAECGIARARGEASYDYVDKVLKGDMDSQADLFNFNFLTYSGSFVLDRERVPHLTTLQPLRIELLNGGAWQITTPDGTQYVFDAAELTQPAVASGYQQGASAWYLTTITTRFGEQVQFTYGDYSASYEYPPNFTAPGVGSLPTATTSATYHSCGILDNYGAQCDCPTEGAGSTWWTFDRPGVRIQGKYLENIVCGPTRMSFFSSAGRMDGTGLRRLDSVQVKYLPDSTRFKRFRMRYDYLRTRLCLRSLTEVGCAPAELRAAPPYKFFYNDPNAPYQSGGATGDNKAPGSPSIDRFGYFNGKSNRMPFLAYKDGQVDLPGADREVDTTCVTFGLLRRIAYPTGGATDFAFESNDFSNVSPAEFYHDPQPIQETVCASNPDPATTWPNCGNLSATKTIRLTHSQRVIFHWNITDDNTNTPITDVDVDGSITDSLGVCANCPSIHFATNGQGQPMPISAFLPAGTYYVAIQLTTPRYIQAVLDYSYVVRRFPPFRGKPGGGTRIRRIASYDGIDHRRDVVKKYYYRDDANTHSTGKLSHDMAFATWVDKWRKVPGWAHCRYLQRSAQDVMGGGGTTAPADVGYDTVTVVQHNGGETLKSRSIFTNVASDVAQLGTNTSILPGYASRYNFYEQNGRLLSTLEWKVRAGGDGWSNADCQLVRRVDNVYTDSVVNLVDNLLIGGEFGDADSFDSYPCRAINAQQYHTQSFWSPLVERTETLYGPQASSYTATTTRWYYHNLVHQQPTWEVSSSSGGAVLKRFKYALDYAPFVASATLLQQQYMLTTPLEQQQWRQQSPVSARKWVGGTLTTYASSPTSGAVPTLVQQANLAVPNATVQEPQNAAGAFTALVSDPAYQPRAAYAYDGTGDLAEQHLTGQPVTSYIWGYGDHHLIASAHNANHNAIAYTSFEPHATGQWQYDLLTSSRYVPAHFTGTRGYQLDGTPTGAVRCTGLPAGEYELWVWAYGSALPVLTGNSQQRHIVVASAGAGSWNQHRFWLSVPANGTVTVNATPNQLLWIDELRLLPAGAQMTSFTHDPLIGVTSQTDPSGRTTTYEYDALGRLIRTRDGQGRILSQQQYHYARP